MKSHVFSTIFSLVTFCMSSYSQINNAISISEIRNHIEDLSISIKSEAKIDKMDLINEVNGERWIYIENNAIDGLYSDEESLSLDLSKIIIKMLYKSVNYNLEESISLNSFADIMKSKTIKGVQFKTKNNKFLFNWDKFTAN